VPEQPRWVEGTGGYGVRRLHFSELSVAAFRRGMVQWAEPIIAEGLGSFLASEESLGFALEFLREALPSDLQIPVKLGGQTVPGMPVCDFFDLFDRGEEVYLADLSVADYFPWLFQHISMPRYIHHCFAHRTRLEHRWARNKTPALFVGQEGSNTPLHVDQLCSSFCMFLTEGSKQWTCFHRDDKDRLKHEWDEGEQIRRFRPLQDDGGVEVAAAAASEVANAKVLRRVDFVLREGEVLFVPFNTPHEVRNLTPTVAVAANYWDQANFVPALEQMEAKLARLDPAGARHGNLEGLQMALHEIDWPCLEDDLSPGDDALRSGEDMAVLHSCHEAAKSVRPTSWGA